MDDLYSNQPAQPDTPPTNVSNDADLQRRLNEAWREARPWAYSIAERRNLAHRFYAGEQWDEKQKAELRKDGRPPVVINQVFKAINNVSGKQRDARLNYKVFPRGENDVVSAAGATRGMRYLEDATDFRFTESRVFKDATLCWGWVEVGYDESDPNKEPVFVDYVPDDEMVVDPFGRNLDLSDYRYIIRRKEVDEDLAIAAFPGKEAIIRMAVVERRNAEAQQVSDDYGNRDNGTYSPGFVGPSDEGTGRRRVMLRDHLYWETEDTEYIQLPDGEKLDYDPQDPVTFQVLQAGGQVMQGKRRCFYRTTMANDRILETKKVDLPFERFSYVQLRAFTNHLGQPSGLVDQMVWPQRELNVNRSRANESMRSRWLLYAKGALGGHHTEEQVAQMMARSNFVLEVNDPNGVNMGSDKTDVAAWSNLMETSRREVDEVAGQNEAAYGDKSNEKSGKAIERRVHQQSLNIGELWDNWRYFRLQVGRMMLALAIKYWTPEKWARIIEQSVIAEHTEAMQQAALMGTPLPPQADLAWVGRAVVGINSLFRYDLKLEDQAETTTERQASMDQAIELVGFLPDQAKMAVVPDIIRMSDFSDKDQMAAKAEAAMQPAPMPAPPPGVPPQMAGPPGPPQQMTPQPPTLPASGGSILPPELAG